MKHQPTVWRHARGVHTRGMVWEARGKHALHLILLLRPFVPTPLPLSLPSPFRQTSSASNKSPFEVSAVMARASNPPMVIITAATLLVLAAAFSPAAVSAQPTATAEDGDCTCKCCSGDACSNNMFSYNTFHSGSAAACSEAACRAAFSACPDVGTHSSQGIVVPYYLDCTCSCCMGAASCSLTDYVLAAGDPSRCSSAACATNFAECPSPGGDSQNYATYNDCTCKCCADEEDCAAGQYTYDRFFAGTAAACSIAQCSGRFAQCPDAGSHNGGLTTEAMYSGPNWDDVDKSCECACCTGSACDTVGRTTYYFFAEQAAMCSPQACSANFQQCPDTGSHNQDGEVFATFFDCTCDCCEGDACPTYTTGRFTAGAAGGCTVDACQQQFQFCPSSGGSVMPTYNVLLNAGGYQASPSGGGSSGLAPGAWAGIAVLITVVVCALIGAAIFVWHKRRNQGPDELKTLMSIEKNPHQEPSKV